MDRYREVVDNWERFKEESETESIRTVRKNPLKAKEGFESRLRDNFEDVEQSEWNSGIYRLHGEKKPGNSMMHWIGEYYVQEESAGIPVHVMDPQPGEKIVDLCAAPGGKATQIAARMENNGTVVANDVSGKRMQSLHANVYRTGSASVVATNRDGMNFPGSRYDRVLVDAPCTGEGNRYRRTFEAAKKEESEELSNLQFELMKRASELVKEGGEVVYSTCTITPLENEAVVQKVLEETDLKLQRIDPEFPYMRGVKEFEQLRFRGSMEKTVRVLPHHLNSGAIFIAKFKK